MQAHFFENIMPYVHVGRHIYWKLNDSPFYNKMWNTPTFLSIEIPLVINFITTQEGSKP
jgi:hypothetical protein